MLLLRMMWNDWGFAPALFRSATQFLGLARQTSGPDQEAFIRATIVFSLMTFEAFFWEAVRGYIQNKSAAVNPQLLSRMNRILARRTPPIRVAVRDWLQWLTGNAFTPPLGIDRDFDAFVEYRNAIVHGAVVYKIPGLGKLAQELETVPYAELAVKTISEMIKSMSSHLSFDLPSWINP